MRRWAAILPFLAVVVPSCSDLTPSLPPPESDREFDGGSRIEARELSAVQVENLVLLGQVWGFAKYHHPRVTGGHENWDYALFRVMPLVLEAPDAAAAADEISAWLAALGEIRECTTCAPAPTDVHLLPDNAWIEDEARLGAELSGRLVAIHRNRSAIGTQHYVSLQPNVQNANFEREATYPDVPGSDAGYRMLALYRYWNVIKYWFPYRDVMEEDWDAVLREFVPLFMAPTTTDEYRLTLARLTARIHDSHANVWFDIQPPHGSSVIPVIVRFVEDQAVVTGYLHARHGPATGLNIGDVIEEIDGEPVAAIVERVRPYYPASNEPALLRRVSRRLTAGSGPAVVTGSGADGGFQRTVLRVPLEELDLAGAYWHDRPGATYQTLSDEVAYIKLSTIVPRDLPELIEQAIDKRVLVIDIRNYPTAFVPFTLGGRLVDAPTPFARFTFGSLVNPGAFLWGPPVVIAPRPPRFPGAVVILVDEATQSSAEYHAMAFRASPDAIVVGSTTAGADGNVSRVPLPHGITARITGIGVFYPDATPTQRIGIVPDVVVRPTIAGIRAGRDEVLEAGVSHALGRGFRP